MQKIRDQWIYLILFIGVSTVTLVLVLRGETEKSYVNKIQTSREQVLMFMQNAAESPFTPEERINLQQLDYFPADIQYRVTAQVSLIESQDWIIVPTSLGTEDRYIRYGYADFELQGTNHRLLLLKSLDSSATNQLFLAFHDKTNGIETYGGGRFIDLYQQSEGEITIDFNLAYNPYCVYNDSYICPLPPTDNALDIPIPAGEKMYPEKS